jgi:hypothetical protein
MARWQMAQRTCSVAPHARDGITLRGPLLVAAIFALAATACGSAPPPRAPVNASRAADSTTLSVSASPSPALPAMTSGATSSTPTPGPRLRAIVATLHLAMPLSRSAAVPVSGGLILLGGMTPDGTTADRVYRLTPTEATPALLGRLSRPVHDVAAAPLASSVLVFGGGAKAEESVVQRIAASGTTRTIGTLPRPRADLSAIAVAGGVLVAGGGAHGTPDRAVLLTTDGRRFRAIATLPIGVRYAAMSGLGGYVYLLGGETQAGDVAAIQRIDPVGGGAVIVGALPFSLSHASAFTIAGRLFLAGGRRSGTPQDGIWQFDPAIGTVHRIGRLPYAVSDAATAVLDGVGYVIGGEGTSRLATIIAVSFR